MKKREESVGCVIFNPSKDEVLLIKRRDIPVWVLPGGGIDPKESPEEAVVRETLEETGLEVEICRKVALYHPANRLTRPTHFFECTPIKGALTVGVETREIAFFPLKALPSRLVPSYKTWIDDALKEQSGVIDKAIEKASYWTLLHYSLCHPLLVLRFLLTQIGVHLNSR